MTPAISLNIALWIWMVAAAAALGGTIAILIMMVRENEFVWQPLGIGFLGWLTGTGLLTSGLITAGSGAAALIVWRALAALGIVLVLFTLLVVRFKKPATSVSQGSYSPPSTRSMSGPAIGITIVGTLLMLGQTILAFKTSGLTEMRNQLPAAEPVIGAAASTLDVVSVVWMITLGLLGLGAVMFLLFFAKSVRFGGAPQIETHWGGIGGGAGGWRMSPSLSYLVVASVLLVLFSVFLMRFDRAKREEKVEEKPATKVAATASPTAKPTATPKASPKSSPAAEEPSASPNS